MLFYFDDFVNSPWGLRKLLLLSGQATLENKACDVSVSTAVNGMHHV